MYGYLLKIKGLYSSFDFILYVIPFQADPKNISVHPEARKKNKSLLPT